MPPFRNVLVDVDAGASVHPALERGARIARGCGARLKVVDVVCPTFEVANLWSSHAEDLVRRRHDRLSSLVRDLDGITADVDVLRGEPAAALTQEVLRAEHDLLVRSHVRDVVARGPKPLGDVGTRLFRQCPCPVWAVGPGAVPARPRIVGVVRTATDDAVESEMNLKVIDLALFIADVQRGSVVLLEAWQPYGEGRVQTHATDDDFCAYLAASERRASTQLRALCNAYEGSLAGVRLDLRKGEPEDVIPEYVVAHGIDTIVMGTVARSGIARVLFGNTVERLLKKVPCSVIAVKPGGFVSPVHLEGTA